MKPVIKRLTRLFLAGKKQVLAFYNKTKKIILPHYRKTLRFIDKRPITSFYSAIALFVLLIVLSNLIFRPKTEIVSKELPTKPVRVYSIGQAPTIRVQAQIRKTGVIQIQALSGGVVSAIYFTEGAQIEKGQTLLSLSSNYQGGNAPVIQRQIAKAQYDNIAATYDQQIDLIHKQREIANNTDLSSDDQRKLASQSAQSTEVLIHFNQDTIILLEQQLEVLQADPVANTALITSTRQMIGQLRSGVIAADSQLRTLQQQANANGPQAQNARLAREATNKQLDIQEKQLAIQKEIARLGVVLATVNEAAMFPIAPFGATVERVFVTPYQQVSPGTPLITLSTTEGSADPTSAVAYVSKEVASKVSRAQESKLIISGTTSIAVTPYFVSTEAVQGSLYGVYFLIPDQNNKALTNKGYIAVDIPVGYPDTSSAIPFVPLDSVYQSRDSSYLFVAKKGKAKSKKVSLGNVFGQYVEVASGLSASDQVILDRTVTDGDPIAVQ